MEERRVAVSCAWLLFFFHVKAAFSAAPLPLSYLHLITVASLLSLCLYVSHQLFLSLCYLVATLPHSTGYSKRLPCRFIAHTRTHAHKRAHKEARACMCVLEKMRTFKNNLVYMTKATESHRYPVMCMHIATDNLCC